MPYNLSIAADAGEYEDSHVAHIGQFFFDDGLYSQVVATHPYTEDKADRILTVDDSIQGDDSSTILTIIQEDDVFADGLIGTVTA